MNDNLRKLHWWDAIKERLRFFGGITLCMAIDLMFLLMQRVLVLGYKWSATKLHVHLEEGTSLSPPLILEIAFEWGTLLLVLWWLVKDVITLIRRMR